MKVLQRKLKRVNKGAKYFYYFLLLVYIISYAFFTMNLISLKGIETGIRVIFILFFLLWGLFYFLFGLIKLIQKKYKGFIISSVVSFIFIILFVVVVYYISIVSGGLKNMQDTDKSVYTTYLVKLKEKKFNKESVIGRINNEEDYEGYVLTKNIIEKEKLTNKINNFDDYLDMVYALYNSKIDALFVPSNYVSLFRAEEGLENIETDTEIVFQFSEKNKNKEAIIVSDKDFEEPLTFLIMGVDSTIDGLNANAGFNGDTLMFISFNPRTFDILMLSIPRDTYAPIKCNNSKYSKINSAAAFGTKCVIDTVSSFLDVNIDYYVKINFKGVVNLVDALGGVEVDVEAPTYMAKKYGGKMCEQNSDRQFGDKLVCIEPGMQVLNGEEALAYARNRHMYIGSDLDRIRHQQQIVESVGKKLLNFSTLADFQKIFNAISNNIATNMEKDKILSGYDVVKSMALNALNGEEFVNINKAYLETYNLPVYLPATGNYTSAQGYYVDSLNDIKDAIQITLDKKEKTIIKSFSFSVNQEYKPLHSGAGKRKEKALVLMPNLIGSSISKAEEFCSENNIELKIEYVNHGEQYYNSSVTPGLIGDQSVKIGTLLNNVTELIVYIPNAYTPVENNEEDKKEKDDSNKELEKETEKMNEALNID